MQGCFFFGLVWFGNLFFVPFEKRGCIEGKCRRQLMKICERSYKGEMGPDFEYILFLGKYQSWWEEPYLQKELPWPSSGLGERQK